MEAKSERKLLDRAVVIFAQFQYAIEAARSAGLDVVSRTNGESWFNKVTINTTPRRTLTMSWRDDDYWVTAGKEFFWPNDGSYGFQHEKPFRQSLHAFITDQSVDENNQPDHKNRSQIADAKTARS